MKKVLGALVLIVALAGFLRLIGLTHDSFWLDEADQTMVDLCESTPPTYAEVVANYDKVIPTPRLLRYHVLRPAWEVVSTLREHDPTSGPLYSYLLRYWVEVTDLSDASVRLFSVVFSLATVAAIFGVTYKIAGLRAAIFAGLFAAISPLEIHYGREARMYSLVEFASIVSTASLFAYLFRTPPPSIRYALLLTYAVGTWAVFQAHYTSIFLIAFHIVISGAVLLLDHANSLRRLVELLCVWILIALLNLPWLPLFFETAAHRNNVSPFAVRHYDVWTAFLALLDIRQVFIHSLVGVPEIKMQLLNFTAGMIMFCSIVVSACAVARLRLLQNARLRRIFARWKIMHEQRVALVFLWSWFLLPLFLLWISDVAENRSLLWTPRYSMYCLPPALILSGIAVSWLNLRSTAVRLFLTIHILMILVTDVAFAFLLHERHPWHEMARYVEAHCATDEWLLITPHLEITPLNRYLTKPHLQMTIRLESSKEAVAAKLNSIKKFSWIVSDEFPRMARLVPERFRLVEKQEFRPRLAIYRYVERPTTH